MSLFSWLFGRKRAQSVQPEPDRSTVADRPVMAPAHRRGVVRWRPDSYPLQVVGESHYQDALIAICGRYGRTGVEHECRALIELEPANPYDTNAVAVRIEGRKVGYLAREQAARIAAQMREDGIASAECAARIRGGWRTNQHDEGDYGVYLGIPSYDWIDFGLGKTPPPKARRTYPRKEPVKRPAPASSGPLAGERIALQGTPPDGALARELASQGAHIMTRIGKSTTLLVVAQDRPFDPGTVRSATYRKAEEQIANGSTLRILSRSEVRQLCQPSGDG